MMEKKAAFVRKTCPKYRNVLMGVQIVLIIAFHFSGDAYYVRDSRIIQLFYKYIRSSGVDMFLLLSGIGLYFSWKKRPEAKRFYIKRYTRILIPYFIVAIPSWLWLDIFYEHQGWGAFFTGSFLCHLLYRRGEMVLVYCDGSVLLTGYSRIFLISLSQRRTEFLHRCESFFCVL